MHSSSARAIEQCGYYSSTQDKKMRRRLIIAICIIISAIVISSSCTVSRDEGFAIYLTGEDITPARTEALSHIEITEQPIISIQDIIAYNATTHEIELTADAFERIVSLEVPVSGRSFVVCIDKAPVYWGAFWTPISSMSFDGITIWQPLFSEEPYIIKIETGYPSSSFFIRGDPRNNAAVMETLDQAGKLINKQSTALFNKLPRSIKGYIL